MLRGICLLVASLVLLHGAPASAQSPEDLERHRAAWDQAGIEHYEYGYQKYCDCHRDEPPETVVRVEADRIERVFHRHSDSAREVPARDGSLDLYWTIDDLFALIAGAMDRDADVRVTFDDELGYPASVFIDYDRGFVGDELDIRLTSLRNLD